MTTNKHFNSYKEGLDLEFLREYCMEHEERRVMERGKMLEEGAGMIGLLHSQTPSYLLPDMSYNCQAKKRFGNS